MCIIINASWVELVLLAILCQAVFALFAIVDARNAMEEQIISV
jgi:hypothetical protein